MRRPASFCKKFSGGNGVHSPRGGDAYLVIPSPPALPDRHRRASAGVSHLNVLKPKDLYGYPDLLPCMPRSYLTPHPSTEAQRDTAASATLLITTPPPNPG